jgi:hypothetical protein
MVLVFLAREIGQQQEIKRIQLGKKFKIPIFADGMILYFKDAKKLHQKKPKKIMNIIGKAAEHTNE